MRDTLDDLSALARRQALTPPEQRRLEVLLQSSAEARLFHELGGRFDAEDRSPPSPSPASQALVDKLLTELPRGAVPKRRALLRGPWLIAAAALLVASLAGAVVGVNRLLSGGPAPSSSVAPQPGPPSPAVRAVGRPSSLELPATPSARPAAPLLSAESPPPPAPPSAAELLSAAGRARRMGQPARAIELLQTLRTRFPNSAEASASEISLGKLELERGAASAGLGHFDGYLRRSPGGALAPEALWGRAQALTRLGRRPEATASLTELLQRFPSSPYASSARAKLAGSPPRP